MLLLDNSAWSRLNSGGLAEERREEVMTWMAQGEIATCLPFLLEAGYSARSAADHRTMMNDMGLLSTVQLTVEIEGHALQAQRELAAIGHHRLPPTDIMIAACAHEADIGILHYDSDYDILATKTSLRFHSEWLSPPGTL